MDFKKLVFIGVFCLSLSGLNAQNLDIELLQKLNIENPEDDKFWMGVTNSIKWVPAAYVGGNLGYGLIAKDKDALRYSLESSLSMGFSMAISGGLKHLVKRPRPTATYPELIHSYAPPSNLSFPSSHSALAFSMSTTAAYQTGGKWYFVTPIYSFPIGVGYSRMRLGRHYPSDVLVGMLIGIGSGILGHWVTGQIVR